MPNLDSIARLTTSETIFFSFARYRWWKPGPAVGSGSNVVEFWIRQSWPARKKKKICQVISLRVTETVATAQVDRNTYWQKALEMRSIQMFLQPQTALVENLESKWGLAELPTAKQKRLPLHGQPGGTDVTWWVCQKVKLKGCSDHSWMITTINQRGLRRELAGSSCDLNSSVADLSVYAGLQYLS